MIDTPLSARLVACREAADMTQAQLARLAGLSLYAIENYERGKSEPNFRGIRGLCKALGISAAVLVDPADHGTWTTPASRSA